MIVIPSHPWLERSTAELTYSDPLSSRSPDIELKLIKRANYSPIECGEIIDLKVAYPGEIYQLKLGLFTVDRVDSDRNFIKINATGTPLRNPELRMERDEDYAEYSLKMVLEEVGDRYGLKVFIPNFQPIYFSQLTQKNQSDLDFLVSLSDRLGSIFKIENNTIIFTPTIELERKLPSFTISESDIIDRNQTETQSKQYQFIDYEVMLFGETDIIRVEDDRIDNGQSIFYRGAGVFADDEELFKMAALDKLREINSGPTVNLNVKSNPLIVSGSTFLLSNKPAIITNAVHSCTGARWLAAITCRLLPS